MNFHLDIRRFVCLNTQYKSMSVEVQLGLFILHCAYRTCGFFLPLAILYSIKLQIGCFVEKLVPISQMKYDMPIQTTMSCMNIFWAFGNFSIFFLDTSQVKHTYVVCKHLFKFGIILQINSLNLAVSKTCKYVPLYDDHFYII